MLKSSIVAVVLVMAGLFVTLVPDSAEAANRVCNRVSLTETEWASLRRAHEGRNGNTWWWAETLAPCERCTRSPRFTNTRFGRICGRRGSRWCLDDRNASGVYRVWVLR